MMKTRSPMAGHFAALLMISLSGTSITAFAGPKYAPPTKPLSQDFGYFQQAGETDYWKLAPFYLPQHNSKACSVASTVMVLNAIQALEELKGSDQNLTSESFVKENRAFARAVGSIGKGMDLDALAKNLQPILDQRFKGRYEAKVHRFDGDDKVAERNKLVELLTLNEKNPRNFVIANYLQGVVTGDAEGVVGHLSPVGAYDAKQERVLILDSDRQYYEPYWTTVDKFMEALNTVDGTVKKARGLVFVTQKQR